MNIIQSQFWRLNIMTEEKTKLTITQEDDNRFLIQGDEEEVKKISMLIAEHFLKEDKLTEEQLETIVDIAERLWNCGKGSPEHLKAAEHFLEAIEKYSYPRALNVLAWIQKNPLISESIEQRAAAVGDPPTIDNFVEEYTAQAAYWRKRINEAEEKPFDGAAPTTEEILDSNRLRFFNIYKRAFDGDLEAMKICLEFCEAELNYWNNRY